MVAALAGENIETHSKTQVDVIGKATTLRVLEMQTVSTVKIFFIHGDCATQGKENSISEL